MTDVVTERRRPAALASAGSTRAGGCSTRPSSVFGELGYHDASIVKLTEAAGVAQGTFYLYFDSKKAIFDELVRDLNRRVRHAMKEGSSQGDDAARGGAARLRGVLPVHGASTRRSTGSSARPSSSRRRCSATTTTASRQGYVEALREAVGGRRDRRRSIRR